MKDKFYFKKNYYILLFAMFFAIAFRSYLEWLLFDFGSDKIVRMATAINLANGNGISISYVSSNDLAQIEYEKIGLWPPGYALCMAFLIKMGFSLVGGTILLEIIAVCILFYSFYLIFKLYQERLNHFFPISFFVFYGVSVQPFNILNSAGLVALSFFVLGFYFLLRNINKKSDLCTWFFLGIYSFLPSLFHFSYYPLSVALPLLLLMYAYLFDISLKKPAILNVLICGMLISVQLFYQASLPTGISYLNEYHPITDGVPYWKNLAMFFNLPIYLLTDGYLLKRTILEVSSYLYLFISVFTGLSFLAALIVVKKNIYIWIRKEKMSFLKKGNNQLVIFCLILCWVIILFMIFLSLYYPAEEAEWAAKGMWTYVAEARYFAPVIIILPVAIAIGLSDDLKKPFVKIPFLIIIISGLLFSTLTNLFYIYKYGSGSLEENYGRYYHHNFEFDKYLEEKVQKNAKYQLIYVQSSEIDEYAYYPKLKNIPVLKYKELNSELRTSKPVKIIFNYNLNLDPETQILISKLIKRYKLKPIRNFPDLNLMTYELTLE